MEAGLPGLIVLAAFAAIVVALFLRARSDSAIPGSHSTFAALTIIVVALHSIVDYPLRTLSIACLFSFAIAILLPPAGHRSASGVNETEE
ncbi:hypothetical protein [Croceicoccus sp. YJ47]|uniref:hypothetical protein n=1 Tax=Croceicoccus sp. YJ47 TaxID=2798724 RepID=UPI001924555F|nr:hypothetical protein [Croceicoccus sp. YJ47]QQN72981.1 hypothetical protein JD971_08715 [Croceicoccus sp. YJ47]